MTRNSLNSPLEAGLPDWIPDQMRHYLAHTTCQTPQSALAAEHQCHPSTISRQIAQVENRRDDPLMDSALDAMDARLGPQGARPAPQKRDVTRSDIAREGRRVLRRLCEKGAVLVVAQDMDRAVILRQADDGSQTRIAVMTRAMAEAFVVQDWIAPIRKGRVATYRISATGKIALKRLIEEDRRARQDAGQGVEGAQAFRHQHGQWSKRQITDAGGVTQTLCVALPDSPLAALARRRGADGQPFLSNELVMAGERLREDFERAQMGPRVAQNWDRFLTMGDRGGFGSSDGLAHGPRAARDRVLAAIEHMGPGLGDVVMRICCFLEGIEATERRLGWSARSGKIVLKLGLERLATHYARTAQPHPIDHL